VSVNAQVHSDAVEPSVKVGFAPKLREHLPRPDESVLGYVHRRFTIVRVTERQVVNFRLVAPNQFGESILVASLSSLNQTLVRPLGHRHEGMPSLQPLFGFFRPVVSSPHFSLPPKGRVQNC
jgi:hypothetical protein